MFVCAFNIVVVDVVPLSRLFCEFIAVLQSQSGLALPISSHMLARPFHRRAGRVSPVFLTDWRARIFASVITAVAGACVLGN
jgi:hypothetical protein